ncbi:MAG: hypothetical protein R6U44_08060 [Archaeoglobaceae archaeon]
MGNHSETSDAYRKTDEVLELLGDRKPRSSKEVSKAIGLPMDLVERIINFYRLFGLVEVREGVGEVEINEEGIRFLSPE